MYFNCSFIVACLILHYICTKSYKTAMSQSKVSEKKILTSPGKVKDQNPLNLVVFTIDPKLDNLESRNVLSSKTVAAKKMFSNYRKVH